MRKYISVLSLVLFLGFLVFNISSNPLKRIPPLGAALLCPPNCVPPTVTTSPASSITRSEATLNGEVTDAGGGSLVERGFEYGLTDSYGSTVTETTSDIGVFSANVDLSCGVTYHYRAYGINTQAGPQIGYGDDVTFSTPTCILSSGSGGGSRSVSAPSSPEVPSTNEPVTPPSPTGGSGGEITAPAPSVTPPPEIIPPVHSHPITGTLVYGSTGNEVKTLQAGLNAAGFNSGPVDGIFGPITKGAVIRFQVAHGLVGDGIVGLLTRAALNSR